MNNSKLAILRINSLSKSYSGNLILNNISLEILPSMCLGILGINGAGKSTLVRSITGVSDATYKKIEVNGKDIKGDFEYLRSKIGVVQQYDLLEEDFSVIKNLEVYGNYYCISKNLIQKRIDYLLKLFNLSQYYNLAARYLSGGMRRRLCIARSMLNNPDLLVLDEPTSGLDLHSKYELWSTIRRIKSSGKSIILMTHVMDEAEKLCDKVSILKNHTLSPPKTPSDLITKEVEKYVIELYDDEANIAQFIEHDEITRIIKYGACFFCYTNSSEKIFADLQKNKQFHYKYRESTLEDVFLRLTE